MLCPCCEKETDKLVGQAPYMVCQECKDYQDNLAREIVDEILEGERQRKI